MRFKGGRFKGGGLKVWGGLNTPLMKPQIPPLGMNCCLNQSAIHSTCHNKCAAECDAEAAQNYED